MTFSNKSNEGMKYHRHSNDMGGRIVKRWNRYNDMEINLRDLPTGGSIDDIIRIIKNEERNLRRETANGLFWIKVPFYLNHIIPFLTRNNMGFNIHHATKDYVMLIQKCSKEPPTYSTHHIRVECIVFDKERSSLLVIDELIGRKCYTKFVTGGVNLGESIPDAAKREVYEETGIDAHFYGIMGLQNRHNARFGRDELTIECLLQVEKSQQATPRSPEVLKIRWVPIDDATVNLMRNEGIVQISTTTMDRRYNTVFNGDRNVCYRVLLALNNINNKSNQGGEESEMVS
jgi:8-oxo-dGTP pyrophosphatase MutT (NUDIX family)